MPVLTNEGGAGGLIAEDGPAVEGLLVRLIDRLERVEQKLDRLEAAVGQAPASIAMVADTLDGLYGDAGRAGVDIDERLKLGLQLLERLTEPRTIAALTGLLAHAETLEQLAHQAPGMMAMIVDVADELYSAVLRQGVDLEQSVRTGLAAFRDFLAIVESPEVQALLASGVLDPQTLTVISHAAHALVQSRRSARPAGVGALLTAPFRRDIQATLGFALSFSEHFGGRLAAEDDQSPLVRQTQ